MLKSSNNNTGSLVSGGIVNKLAHNYSPVQMGGRWYYWGETDSLPQLAEDIANNNGIFRAAVNKIADYIKGKGFIDEQANLFDTNSGVGLNAQPLPSLLLAIAKQAVFYDGAFAIQVRRNKSGSVVAIDSIDLGSLRLSRHQTTGGRRQWIYNRFRNRIGYNTGHDILIPEYSAQTTPKDWEMIRAFQKKNYNHVYGEVLVHYIPDVGVPYYPIPKWFSSAEIIYGNSASSKAFLVKANSLFVPSVVISTPMMDESVPANGGQSEGQKMRAALKSQIKSDEPMPFFHITGVNPNNMPTITPLDVTKAPSELVTIISESARLVCQLLGVDPILLGFATTGQLGNNQQMSEAEQALNNLADGYRKQIFSVLEPILRQMGFAASLDVDQYKNYSYIPDKLIDVLTPDERRAYIGYDPLPVDTTAKTNGVIDTLNTISPLVANKILDAFSKEQILQLVGLQPDNNDPMPPSSTDPNQEFQP